MSAKHTPGPWHAFTTRPPRVISEAGADEPSETIAILPLAEYRDLSPEQFGNIRLIAAAPELLAALRTLTELLRAGAFVGTEDLDAASAAIAKAEGAQS